ncbi:MAG: hypothetical protein KDK70_09215, partial [Myxococcales bacterium]|nr:hypothetical protein [Myxococcales bacterium]
MPTSPPAHRRRSLGLAAHLGLAGLGLACHARSPGASAPAEPAPLVAIEHDASLDELRLLGLLDALASDELGGRYTLHDDIRRAAEAITTHYREAGVAAASPEGYLLDFEIMVGIDPGPRTALVLDATESLAFDPEVLVPRPEGAAGEVEGPLVFVGYG